MKIIWFCNFSHITYKFSLTFLLIWVSIISYSQNTYLIKHDKNIIDYAPVFQQTVDNCIRNNGGSIFISSGNYLVSKPIEIINNQSNLIQINFIGIKGRKGELPVLFDTSNNANCHTFLKFQGDIDKLSIGFAVKNLSIIGNNLPFSSKHPFINRANYVSAIQGLNIKFAKIKYVDIKNMYGTGICLANYMDNQSKTHRIQNPIVENCTITGTWGWSGKDDMGDGVLFWQAYSPVVRNCVIINNLNRTKHLGRCGIVLEHNTEGAIIENNRIGGYDRNIHIECDYGGHRIFNNIFSKSYIGITLSYDCNQEIRNRSLYSSTLIENNLFRYDSDYQKNNIIRNDFGFISIYKSSFVIEGLSILNNTFMVDGKKKVNGIKKDKIMWSNDSKVFYRFSDQSKILMNGNNIE